MIKVIQTLHGALEERGPYRYCSKLPLLLSQRCTISLSYLYTISTIDRASFLDKKNIHFDSLHL